MIAASVFARRTGVAAPLLLVALGIGASYLPSTPAIHLEPEIILAGVLPPLLYASAVQLPVLDVRRNVGLIAWLSIVMVIVSALVVGALVHALFPSISFALATALGAVVSPTDAVAATAIGHRVGLPPRLMTVLEGESLVNDASALVVLRTAVAALAVTAHFSLGHIVLDFAWAVVGAILDRGGRRAAHRRPAAAPRRPGAEHDDLVRRAVPRVLPGRGSTRVRRTRGGRRRAADRSARQPQLQRPRPADAGHHLDDHQLYPGERRLPRDGVPAAGARRRRPRGDDARRDHRARPAGGRPARRVAVPRPGVAGAAGPVRAERPHRAGPRAAGPVRGASGLDGAVRGARGEPARLGPQAAGAGPCGRRLRGAGAAPRRTARSKASWTRSNSASRPPESHQSATRSWLRSSVATRTSRRNSWRSVRMSRCSGSSHRFCSSSGSAARS